MSDVKNACSRAATLEQAAKESTCENVSLDPDYNAYDGPISSLLSYGEEHASEIRRFVGSMRGRARKTLETAAAVENGGRGNG
ncbi:MAG: hypothetical protein LUC98_05145 [Lachnospiraceae bacterium]|nr:hypothetical protein [Lachnospiraceae bacterium]